TNLSAMADEQTVADEHVDEEQEQRLDPEVAARRQAALSFVRQWGDPVLKSRARPVDRFDDDLRTQIEQMGRLMEDALGIGLAATQLGVLRRLLVFQAGPDAEPTALANPEVEWLSDDVVVAEEGCLSLPRVSMDVERPLFVRVSGQDAEGKRIVIEAAGLEARVLQHEIDHLDGVLILDRTTRPQRKGALRALREGGTYHPPSDDDDEDELREPRTDA
ncbi:MAG TPA: peptide deformylase, partial [Solirubrobacterales bacterium]|nr:peptide deformylase [Solirubrobacterales bacterium]